MVRKPEHEGPDANEVPDALRRPPRLDAARTDEDHLPPEGQEQDPAQEALVPVHVHVLLPRLSGTSFIPASNRINRKLDKYPSDITVSYVIKFY